jgi:hypothetical protein
MLPARLAEMVEEAGMSARAAELAERFERANREVIALVSACTDADWQRLTPAEGRTVGITAHHIAVAYPMEVQAIQAIADGHDVPITMADVDAFNARHRVEQATCTPSEVEELLRQNGAIVVAAIRAMTDAQLNRRGRIAFMGDAPASVARFIERLLIGHIGWHLEDMGTTSPPGPLSYAERGSQRRLDERSTPTTRSPLSP